MSRTTNRTASEINDDVRLIANELDESGDVEVHAALLERLEDAEAELHGLDTLATTPTTAAGPLHCDVADDMLDSAATMYSIAVTYASLNYESTNRAFHLTAYSDAIGAEAAAGAAAFQFDRGSWPGVAAEAATAYNLSNDAIADSLAVEAALKVRAATGRYTKATRDAAETGRGRSASAQSWLTGCLAP